MHVHFIFLLLIAISTLSISRCQYQPTWNSLDSRPLPTWFDEAKIGIFVHWGVFSVPALHGSNFWQVWEQQKPYDGPYAKFMKDHYRSDWTYADFAKDFTAELFDPVDWVKSFSDAGARYVVFVTKHHEGFCNWNTNYSFNWNSMQVGPKRDLTREIVEAVRQNSTMKLGLYHSLFEWFNPLYLADKANQYRTNRFVEGKTIPELHELVNTYKPDLIWSDGDWEASDEYWQAKQFLAWLYNSSPVKSDVIVNDRWGNNTKFKHGGFWSGGDRYNPKVLVPKKFENCLTLQRAAWGYQRDTNIDGYLTIEELITDIVETVSCGGNVLVNVGPSSDGRILPIFQLLLRQMGDWLRVNGEAIYESKPWSYQNDTLNGDVWYTMNKNANSSSGYSVYAMFLKWPSSNKLVLGSPRITPDTKVRMLGVPNVPIDYQYVSGQLVIILPSITPNLLPSTVAWTLRMDDLAN